MPRHRNYFPKNKWWEISNELRRTELPAEILCYFCQTMLPRESYSTSQQDALRRELHKYGLGSLKDQKIAKCKGCASENAMQRKCRGCAVQKPLAEFSKSQIKNMQPLCIRCIDWHLENEPRDDRDRMIEGTKSMPYLTLADFSNALEHPTGQAQIEGAKGMAVEDLWDEKNGRPISEPSQSVNQPQSTVARKGDGTQQTTRRDSSSTVDNPRPQNPSRMKSHINESSGEVWNVADFL